MATARDVLDIARDLLNDTAGLTWTDALLMEKLRLACKELAAKLALNDISYEVEEIVDITVNAGDTDLGANLPTDLIEPISMKEKGVGEEDAAYVNMAEKDWTPDLAQTDMLRYWVWQRGKIKFLGSTATRVIQLRYTRLMNIPIVSTDILEFPLSEIFLGPRVAALTYGTKESPQAQAANAVAQENLSTLIRIQVKGSQSLPARRRPFGYRLRRGRRFSI